MDEYRLFLANKAIEERLRDSRRTPVAREHPVRVYRLPPAQPALRHDRRG